MSEAYDARSVRGYCGIGILTPKFQSNVGVLWRTAFNLGAKFMFTIGKRYQYRADVVKSYRHIPLFEYETFEEFRPPARCSLVGIEITDRAENIMDFDHPERATYLLGPEDSGLDDAILDKCQKVIQIPSNRCLNVSATGAIVLYDRLLKKEREVRNAS